MRLKPFLPIPLACCALLAGCFSPDPPLLATSLPNGYSFRSNGGDVGYIAKPGIGRLSTWFGIRSDGGEYWCGDVGWADAMVVCRYAREGRERSHDAGFFVFDTRSGRAAVAADEAAALLLLQAQGVDTMPTLKRRYFFRTRRI